MHPALVRLLPSSPHRFIGSLAGVAAAAVALGASSLAAAAPACSAQSGAQVPTVIELYTSEGCNSCPPADRWLSGLKARDGVVALAFHVDYWDSLGWKDRFAQPQFSQRQSATLRTSGARFPYTPQILLNGRDLPNWFQVPPLAIVGGKKPASVALALSRDDAGLALTVSPGAGAPAELSGYVAVVDDGLQTHVSAGENRGETLRQDGVVRELLPWNHVGAQPSTLHFATTSTPEAGATRHWVAVATDRPYGTPLQAVALACAR